jgi:hypothetical protein
MKQSSSPALEFGSALHAMAEHFQATGEILEPESDVARVLSAGAHQLTICGKLLVEYEHVGTLPDGSPYVAYIDGHSPDGGSSNLVVIQDIKTTSNPRYALQGTDGEPPPDAEETDNSDYDLKRDIQAMLYAWILLCDVHQFRAGPDAPWQTWDPAERRAETARLRWVYFLTKGSARSWEASRWVRPAEAQAYMTATILPLVAKINALHEWHHARLATGGPPPTLDEIDRNLDACNDGRGHYGRWCGAGEREACNYDQLGTPVTDLVQLKVRKMTTPLERLKALQNRNKGIAAPAPTPAPVAEAPAASPPAPPPAPAPVAEAPVAIAASVGAPAAPLIASAPAVVETPASAAVAAAAELTRGQKAAATRAANKALAIAPPPAGNINPPEVTETLQKLTETASAGPAKLTAPVAEEAPRGPAYVINNNAPAAPKDPIQLPVAVVTLVGVEQITAFLVSQGYAVTKAAA